MRLTISVFFVCSTLWSIAANVGVKEDTLMQWSNRREGLRSAKLGMKTSVTVKAGSKGPSTKDSKVFLPINDVTYDEHSTLLVDLTKGRLRRELRGQRFVHGGGLDTFRPYVEYEIFDSK